MPEIPKKNLGTPDRKAFDAQRNSVERNAEQRKYRTQRWRRLRKQHLQSFPLCVTCNAQGLTVAAQVVDHIKPWRGDENLFYDVENLQSLCHRCHNRKSAKELGRKG